MMYIEFEDDLYGDIKEEVTKKVEYGVRDGVDKEVWAKVDENIWVDVRGEVLPALSKL